MTADRGDRASWTSLEAAHALALRPTPDRDAAGPRSHAGAAWLWSLALGIGGLGAVAAAWWFVLLEGQGGPGPLSADAWSRLVDFARQLVGADTAARAAYLRSDAWGQLLRPTLDTLLMSVVAAGLSGIGALATIAPAARSLTHGELATGPRPLGRLIFLTVRLGHTVARAVPELVWALLIVFVVEPGVLAGALAIAIHNLGVLGRLGADVVEEVDPGTVRALRSAGAGRRQVLLYGVLPQVLPQFLTLLLYRWEVMIRTTAIVGFVTAAGLGYALRLDLSFFRYTEVALVLLVYVLLVWAVDLLSVVLRRMVR